MRLPLFDSHCHLDSPAFAPDRLEVLARARAAGIGGLLIPAVTAAGWQPLLDLCRSDPALYPALGLHPLFLDSHDRAAALPRLEQLLADGSMGQRIEAVGEIGLDHYHGLEQAALQRQLFAQQVEVAQNSHRPLILHVRKAHDEVLALLRRCRFQEGGIVHAFNGSQQQAEQFIALGFGIGIGGVVTFERAQKLRRLAATLDLTALVLESDAPDLPPAPYRGQRNEPASVALVAETVATLRQSSLETIAAATTANAQRLLRLPPSNAPRQ